MKPLYVRVYLHLATGCMILNKTLSQIVVRMLHNFMVFLWLKIHLTRSSDWFLQEHGSECQGLFLSIYGPIKAVCKIDQSTDWVHIYELNPAWRTIERHSTVCDRSVRALWSVSTLIIRLNQQTKAVLSSSAFSRFPQPSNCFDFIMQDFIFGFITFLVQFVHDWKWPPLLKLVHSLCIYMFIIECELGLVCCGQVL